MANIRVELEGTDELARKLNALSKEVRGSIAQKAVTAGGEQIMNYARLNIHEVFSEKQTGGLANSISVESKTSGDGAVAEIAPHKVYARIQEFSGTITPVHTQALHWVIDGQDYFAKKVTIPARPYLRPAAEDHIDSISSAMEKAISDGIRQSI